MPAFFLLSEVDRNLIKQFLGRYRQQPPYINQTNRSVSDRIDHEEMPGRSLHVALSPDGGIPGIEGIVPGHADCVIYRLYQNGTYDDYELGEIDGTATETVFNIYQHDVPGNIWVLIQRDRFGYWFVEAIPEDLGTGTGTGSGTVEDAGITVTGWGCTASWRATNCIKLDVISGCGAFADIDTTQEKILCWNGAQWESGYCTQGTGTDDIEDDIVDYVCGEGIALFFRSDGVPKLTINGIHLTPDKGGSINATGECFIDFAGGDGFCDEFEEVGTGDCICSLFVVRLTCVECPTFFYCVATSGECAGTGTDNVIEVLELTVLEAADLGALVCSGPYDTEAEALEVCPPEVVVTVTCGATTDEYPGTIIVTASDNIVNGNSGSGSANLVYDAGLGDATTWVWDGSGSNFVNGNETGGTACGPLTIRWQYRLQCIDGVLVGTFRCSCNDGGDWSGWFELASTVLPFLIGDPGFSYSSCGAACTGGCNAVYLTFAGG